MRTTFIAGSRDEPGIVRAAAEIVRLRRRRPRLETSPQVHGETPAGPPAKHAHSVSDAVIRLENHDAGAHDIPPFEICVFGDGCWQFTIGLMSPTTRYGATASSVVARILLDAESLGFAGMTGPFELPRRNGPDLELTICNGVPINTVVYSPVMSQDGAASAQQQGGAFASQLFTIDLLAARVIDLVSSGDVSVPP